MDNICQEIWDFIENGGYNSQVDEDIVKVMREVSQGKFNSDIAIKLKLPLEYVELIQYILCTLNYAEYGASPRGCWLTGLGLKMLSTFEERLAKEA